MGHDDADRQSVHHDRDVDTSTWTADEESDKRGGRRRTLLVLGAFALVVCLAFGIAGYVLYERATRLDRSTPVVTVFQYVDAVFEVRDDGQAELFECKKSTGRAALNVLLDDLKAREQRYSIRITVSVTNFAESVEGSKAQVQADLLIDVPEADGKPSRSNQRWSFDLRDEDGWRVCSAQRVP